jgi:Xaa-Pro aminopeptidase
VPHCSRRHRLPCRIYILGEIGIRLEDIITITTDGAENLTKWSGTPEEPVVL